MAEDIIDILVTNYNDNVTLDVDPAVTVVNISNLSGLTGIIIPSGTVGKLPYYDTTSTFADSNIYTTGTTVGINNDTPTLYSTNKGMVVRNPAGNVELLLQHDGNTANSIQGLSISTVKTDSAYIFQRENLPLKIGTNDTSRILINAGGNVSIGSSNNTYKLDVNGTAYINGSSIINGNLGLGVTPSAWASSLRFIELPYGVGYGANTGISSNYSVTNAYYNGSNWIYKTSDEASFYQQINGEHQWNTAPSGTAGGTITFTQVMTLNASGNLYIGKTSGVSRFGISGLPTSASGLHTGDVWNDSGTLKIV